MTKRIFLTSIYLGLILGLFSFSAATAQAYVLDGNLSDWGVTPFTDWTPNSGSYTVEDDFNRPYSDPFNELWDLEAMYFDDKIDPADQKHYLYFAVVSSNSYSNHWASEDMGIDFDGDGVYEFAADVGNLPLNQLSLKAVWDVGAWAQLYRTAAGLPPKWFPYRVTSGVQLGLYEIYSAYAGQIENEWYKNTYILEGRIDLSLFGALGCAQCVEIYLPRVTCIKDWITANGKLGANCNNPNPTIPEPGTMTLLGTGLLSLLGFRFKRRVA